MKNRPITTLFMLMSVDGKISSGSNDVLDTDKDWHTISGVKEGIHQYYEIEQTTDLWSLNTGRVMEKIGVNSKTNTPKKIPCNFVIIDNKPHLSKKGIDYLCKWVNSLYIVTHNDEHPALDMKRDNLNIIMQNEFDLIGLLEILKNKYQVERLTIQSGGMMNCEFLRNKLFDYVDVVVAPLLVGGKDTPTLIDGESINTQNQLNELGVLKLKNCKMLEDSYIRLTYQLVS
ncbi:dihydrofolate reductase family protein [Clostridium cibarium]|uniref:Dihydrofolate reductase family protein n=1 Tax=Clostridium cibarium TaxID=2762247 RepID=A0ABR8PYI9_9CLOT|nr:dihydrofolate reductase family protein [Clostridium cibarium]MBD7913240.1 dihydrofolate reductase family protein [Clostridium cibarium]